MTMTRSKLREHIFKALFRAEFHDQEEMPGQIALYLESLSPLSEEDGDYISGKTAGILSRKDQIDQAINERSFSWKTGRMGKAELTILRLAVYEILYDEEIPAGVAIDQAVELAKVFGGDQAPAFVNGVLARFV